MYQIDNPTASSTLPAPSSAGTGGYFTDGNPATGVAPTVVPAEFLNMLMMELVNLVTAAGITPSKSDLTQVTGAVRSLFGQYGLGATSAVAIASLDDATIGAGTYYANSSTAGTWPFTAGNAVLHHRVAGTIGLQFLVSAAADQVWYRRRTGSAWQPWVSLANSAQAVNGQCRLIKSGANLVLSPFNGNRLTINGVPQTVPSGGVSLAATGLTVSTLYFIYAYMNSGVMTLEASTTSHATDSTTGVEIKSGDATRTLVGMARPITGPAFQDTAAQRFVRSWFNDPGIAGFSYLSASRTLSGSSVAPTYQEVNSEIRNEFLCWAGEIVVVGGSGYSTQTVAGITNNTAVAFDGVVAEPGSWSAGYGPTGNFGIPYAINFPKAGLTEGYHYVTLIAAMGSAGGSANYIGGAVSGTAPSSCSLNTYIKK